MVSSDRTVLITGAARGIGLACAQAFARDGWTLAMVDLDAAALDESAQALDQSGARVVPITADVGNAAQIEAAVSAVTAQCGGLTALVNNAGFSQRGPSAEVTLENWDQMLDVHLKGAFLFCRLAYPLLCQSEGAAIVNIASIAAFAGLPQTLTYAVAKAGLLALTRVLAVEWAPRGIRVNAVAPAWVETALVHQAVEIGTVSRDSMEQRIPLGRLARVEEVASAVHYLATAATFVTGQTLLVDGGFTVDGRLGWHGV